MPTRVLRKSKKKYPYRIFPVDLPDRKIIKRIRAFKLWGFLRVQALLRSEKIQALYRQGKRKGAPLLLQRFRFVWEWFNRPSSIVLKGTEDRDTKEVWLDFWETGILDLARLKEEKPDDWNNGRFLNRTPFHATFPLLTVMFDRFIPTETIIKNLRPLLQQRDPSPPISGRRYHQFRIIDPTVPKTYLDYLRSYDLYHCEQLEPQEIGRLIYPTYRKPTMMARTAVKRATKIIRQAEQGEWPPTI